MAHVDKLQKQLNAGTVSLVVLTLLERIREPMYGYQISKILESLTDGDLPMKQGTLYPVLRSLEREGRLESAVEPSSTGPSRRYYRITEAGREALPLWREAWSKTRDFVDRILDPSSVPREVASSQTEK